MNKMLQMHIEYEIKPECHEQYINIMPQVLSKLPYYDANRINWSSIKDGNHFIESFVIPTESHFHSIKQLRQSNTHYIFGLLDECINGGVKAIKCFGLKTQI